MNGFLTLNIDRMAGRSFAPPSSAPPSSDRPPLIEFNGFDSAKRSDVLRVGYPFVANLHGVVDEDQSWVLTQKDFDRLAGLAAYRALIEAIFASRVVLFIGITADDQAAANHLARLQAVGIDLKGHYWLTDRNDPNTDKWAEDTGVSRITYPQAQHVAIAEFLKDLGSYVPVDSTPLPVEPSRTRERGLVLPSPTDLEQMPADDIRVVLNKEAKRILSSNRPDRFELYSSFLLKYSEPIYRSWSINTSPERNAFFDYKLVAPIAKGAFGQVFKAVDAEGHSFAIKVLHVHVRDEAQMLESFRRGVSSMRILSNRDVSGMVPYVDAWEIPAATVMELVDGPNLEEAVEGGFVNEWDMRLRIATELATVIRSAHMVPECVLHRDIRPANIMLKDFWAHPDNWQLVVLDFDLSWHRDATEGSLNLSRSMNGYLAPEQ